MTRTSAARSGRPEYVTDWRAVYSAIGVVVIMVVGVLSWVLHTPTNVMPPATQVANARAMDADAGSGVVVEERSGQIQAVDIVLPWAPLTPERRLPSEVLPPSPPEVTKVTANPDTENSILVSFDGEPKQTPVVESIEESSRIPDFFAELERAVTLDFNPIKTTRNPKQRVSRSVTRRPSTPLTREQQFAQLANSSELAGLPILGEEECHKRAEEVEELARVSRRMALINGTRRIQEAGFFSTLSDELDLEEEVFKFIEASDLDATSVAPLVQILQVSGVGVRMKLVDALSGIEGPEASRALADRALFDWYREVREVAIESLKGRDHTEYRARLLNAFRYPLSTVAYHAAETLVALGDTDVLARLEELLDEPDPTSPFLDVDGTWQKTELVRVNHLRNCLLCHPRSVSQSDKIRGAVPTPGQPLPQTYYQNTIVKDTVRADVTYLRQDFSVMQSVIDSSPWPEMQRFDFFVRTRPLTEKEKQVQIDSASAGAKALDSYPQREAVYFAISGLTKPSS